MNNQSTFFPPDLTTSLVASLDKEKNLNKALSDLVLYIEAKSGHSLLASILLLDKAGKRLFRGAAPSLPDAYCQAIDGIEIGPTAGSCGTAVFCGHSIYVCDIDRDELWIPFKSLASAHGLRACWSVPIIAASGHIFGTFALYYTEVKNPTLEERRFIEECAQYACMLLEEAEDIGISA